MSLEDLVQGSVAMGIQALALTDINNSTGCLDFVKLCCEKGLKPVVGIEFRQKDHRLYTCLAINNEGFREINDYLTKHLVQGVPLTSSAQCFNHVYVIYPFGARSVNQLGENEFIGVTPADVRKIVTSEYRNHTEKLVAFYPVTFASADDFELHRHFRAVDHNILLSQLQPVHYARPSEVLFPPDKVLNIYKDYPYLVHQAEKLISNCSFSFDFKSQKNKRTFTGNPYDDRLLLEKLSLEGMAYRYGKNSREALKRVRHELAIIDQQNFASYFLITWDMIRYSMSRGFYHVGRGSGGNSVIAYCLRITDIDPVELDLYFERFINPKRTSPPDFDIDYSWKDRDDVQDYMFKRYGRQHTALLGAMSTFQGNSIRREFGKVYGLPKAELDAFSENPNDAGTRNDITSKILKLTGRIINFPNLRTIHAGGLLVSELPLSYYTALDLPPKGFATTQWDMYTAEAIGFDKLDILSQRGIGHIKEAVEIVSANRKITVDPHDVKRFYTDEQVKSMLRKGETNGCFYVESPAMRGLLKKLRCDTYPALVAASSIIRPGVSKSGMMRAYIERFHHPEKIKHIHPIMGEVLKETYGVMVYQEDVMKVCQAFAGLDLADADVLRRAMSGKYRSKQEFQRIVDKFFSNCCERGYPEEVTREVWRQIESFAAYSFSKAHSASFAVESFQSLYLKTYFPLEFMVAVINNFGGFYRSWVYFNEAARGGAVIHCPCVNRSTYKTCIYGKDIYIGMVHVANLESVLAEALVAERLQNGEYTSLDNFVQRVNPGLEQIILLIRIGAFRFTKKPKKQLLWEAHMLLNKEKPQPESKSLFHIESKTFQLPDLLESHLEDAYDEIELLGFPVTLSMFDLLQTSFRGEIRANLMLQNVGKKVRMLGNLVAIKYVRTVNRDMMHFGCFLDASGEFFDTVHFPGSLREYQFKGYGIYLILGMITEEFGFPGLTVEKMAKMPLKVNPRYE
jgi:DNA polymerase-3 subunit alpha